MNTVAERIFERQLRHSEHDRQAFIDKTAKSIQQDIYAALQTDDAEAQEIGGDMLGFIESEVMAEIIRRALRGDMQDALIMRQLILSEVDASVRRAAELRAIRHVEAMTPDDFNND